MQIENDRGPSGLSCAEKIELCKAQINANAIHLEAAQALLREAEHENISLREMNKEVEKINASYSFPMKLAFFATTMSIGCLVVNTVCWLQNKKKP